MINKVLCNVDTVLDISGDTLISAEQISSGTTALTSDGQTLTGTMSSSGNDVEYLMFDSSSTSNIKAGAIYFVHSGNITCGFCSSSTTLPPTSRTKLQLSDYWIGALPSDWLIPEEMRSYSGRSYLGCVGYDSTSHFAYAKGAYWSTTNANNSLIGLTGSGNGGNIDFATTVWSETDSSLSGVLTSDSTVQIQTTGPFVKITGYFIFAADHNDADMWINVLSIPPDLAPPVGIWVTGTTNNLKLTSTGYLRLYTTKKTHLVSGTTAGTYYPFQVTYSTTLGTLYSE